MVEWKYLNIVVPASHVEQARELGGALASDVRAGAGMYTAPLSPTGAEPVTHYVSSGLIDANIHPILADSTVMYQAAQYNGAKVEIVLKATQADADYLVAHSDVSEEPPAVVLERLGLKPVQSEA